ncbi:MAG: hypothetical protein J0H55_01685 [Chitinophagaceae bacterium]|nr:hypothetical protein [Chitinophagaceae bacterium]
MDFYQGYNYFNFQQIGVEFIYVYSGQYGFIPAPIQNQFTDKIYRTIIIEELLQQSRELYSGGKFWKEFREPKMENELLGLQT